ncbi:MAG TPA: DUF4405 domain-containing protein [Phycisphaerae bacterium]|nr:DUF4405 domain-containing protein [Phycisphaerae bacterium]HRW52339.1 DUF4405 domain-containing protein [Phycisphaerae bacterium]
MRRSTLNFVVDFVAFLVMLGMIATGLVVRYALPPGTGGRLAIWEMGRHDWGDLHYYLAIALLVLLLLHLALHWAWTCVIADKLLSAVGLRVTSGATGTRSRFGRRLAAGVAALVLVSGSVGGFYWWAQSSIKANDHGTVRRGAAMRSDAGVGENEGPTGRRGGRGGAAVKGSMTLAEISAIAGVSTERMKSQLGLPADLSDDARMGRLRREYGLSMSQIRARVAELTASAAAPS